MRTGLISAIVSISLLAAMHLAAGFAAPGLTWGFHFLAFLGTAAALGYALLAGALLYAGARGLLEKAVLSLPPGRTLLWIGLAFFAAAGFAFRVEVPLLGDSWYLVKNFAGALRGTEELLPRDEPLATYYLSFVLGLFDVSTYSGFLDAVFAGGMALGAAYVFLAWLLTGLLFPRRGARTAAFLLLAALPPVVLFFGYVETYAAVLFVLTLHLLAGFAYLAGRIPFWPVAVAFLAQVLTHYLTALTLPSFVYLAILGTRRGDSRGVGLGIGLSLGIFAALLVAVGFDVTNYFSQVPHKHYLPLVTPEDPLERYSSPYTLFSPYHALDLFNLAVLILAPAIVLAAAAAAEGRTRRDAPRRSDQERFLIASCVPVALFLFVAKFDLGTARDWDVAAPYGLIFVLLSLLWLNRVSTEPAALRVVAVVFGATLLHSILWWGVVGSPTATVERFRALMDQRLMGQGGMYSANLYLSRFYRESGASARRSAELWERYIALYPGDLRGFRNVLNTTRDEGSAAAAHRIRSWSETFGKNPLTDRTMITLALEHGNTALEENRDSDAVVFFEAAVDVDPRSAPAWNNLGTVHARSGRYWEAATLFRRAVELDPQFADAWFNLGRARLAEGREKDARDAFTEAARLGNAAARSLLSTGQPGQP